MHQPNVHISTYGPRKSSHGKFEKESSLHTPDGALLDRAAASYLVPSSFGAPPFCPHPSWTYAVDGPRPAASLSRSELPPRARPTGYGWGQRQAVVRAGP